MAGEQSICQHAKSLEANDKLVGNEISHLEMKVLILTIPQL